jgi:hypothetical protein
MSNGRDAPSPPSPSAPAAPVRAARPGHVPRCSRTAPARPAYAQAAAAQRVQRKADEAARREALLRALAGKDKAPCRVLDRLYIGKGRGAGLRPE